MLKTFLAVAHSGNDDVDNTLFRALVVQGPEQSAPRHPSIKIS